MNIKKYIAEFIGTAMLALAVVGAIADGGGFGISLTAGITLALAVVTIGSISGAHINPAVTLGLLSIKKINWKDALSYIVAQFAGAALALILVRQFGPALPSLDTSFSWTSIVAEFTGALVFTFGIASIVLASHSHDHAESAKADSRAPFAIGASLTIGATVAVALGSNAVLNPAVAFGIGSFGISYVVGPVLGAVAGMWLAKGLRK